MAKTRRPEMDLDTLMQRAISAHAADIPVEDVHDMLIADGATESDFFLVWKAAEILAMPLSKSIKKLISRSK